MLKLSPAKLKFILLKCAYLLAAAVVVLAIMAHFRSDVRQNDDINAVENQDLRGGDETYVSIYEKMGTYHLDTHRGSFFAETADNAAALNAAGSSDETEDDIIVVDVEPQGDGSIAREAADDERMEQQTEMMRQAMYAALDETADLPDNSADVADIFDRLYEETLPDDIIDHEEAALTAKTKANLPAIPERKPPYFAKPMVAIVIDDMGINRKRTADISSLKYPITASFLTYRLKLDEKIDKSIAAGHEIMLHAPMEAVGKVDNAPDVLTTEMSADEIQANLRIMLQKVKNIRGVNNHMGSKLTQDYERMLAVMEVLKESELFFLDSKTSAQSMADKAAAEIGVPHAARNVFLDNNNDKDYILGQLRLTEKLARKNGYAIAIGHPKSQTFVALSEWLPQAEAAGVELTHLSKIVEIIHQQALLQ